MLIEEMRISVAIFLLGTTDYNHRSEDAEQQYHTDDDEPAGRGVSSLWQTWLRGLIVGHDSLHDFTILSDLEWHEGFTNLIALWGIVFLETVFASRQIAKGEDPVLVGATRYSRPAIFIQNADAGIWQPLPGGNIGYSRL